jgi:NADH-quinone oxidoreductase subunit C
VTAQEIHSLLAAAFPDDVLALDANAKDPSIGLRPEGVPRAMRFLKEDPRTAFDFLDCLSGVDLGERLGVVYHLFSYPHRHKVVVKVDVPRADARVPSAALVWRGARWFEREAFDLLGIVFDGHPDLRRIMLPDDWEGHPLRKDYVYPTHYAGVDNRREYE